LIGSDNWNSIEIKMNRKKHIIILLILFGLINGTCNGFDSAPFYYLLNQEWLEYEDISSMWWYYEIWQIDLNQALMFELAALPGLNYINAYRIIHERRIGGEYVNIKDIEQRNQKDDNLIVPVIERIKNIISFGYSSPFEARLHIKSQRRFGSVAEENLERYDGSAYGITQRYWMKSGRYQFGVLLDKDTFEPSLVDLCRYWATWSGDSMKVLIGDFHITTGQGLGIWTRPVYFESYDSPGAYRRIGKGLQPAVDASQNSALRGLAVSQSWGKWRGDVFISNTRLDAIMDDSLDAALRLSNGGLHRTEGESRKQDAVRERLIGGVVHYILNSIDKREVVFHTGGYTAQYSPSFQPDPEPRMRFPLQGGHAGSVCAGFQMTTPAYSIFSETASDHEGHICYLAGCGAILQNSNDINADFVLYHYPVGNHNPRSRPPLSGSNADNRTGTALLITGRPQNTSLSQWQGHIEIQRRSWRSYAVPSPFTRGKVSLQGTFDLSEGNEVRVRYRRSSTKVGHGEEEPTESVSTDRLRLTYTKRLDSIWLERCRAWLGGASRRSNSSASQYGGMAGLNLSGSTHKIESIGRLPLRYSLGIMGFSTGSKTTLYVGESYLPDRISSVRLSGRGLRWSAALTWRQGKQRWLALQAARTAYMGKDTKPSDLEVYFSLSFNITADKE